MSAKSLFPLLPFLLLLSACIDFGEQQGSKATPTASASPTSEAPGFGTPEEAIGEYAVAELETEYAGDCEAATVTEATGKLCSAFREERDGMRAYVAGLAFSEFFTWLFVQQEGGRWLVVSRFDIHEESADVPGTPWPLAEGAIVVVTGTGQCLNVREGPGLEASAIDCINDGTEVTLAQGPVDADGFQWWRLEDRVGWVAGDWLRYPEGPPAPSTPPPGP